jgi:NADH-quinone oxidoreductase subunit L
LTAIYMFRLVFMAFYGTRALPAAAPEHPEEEEPTHGSHVHDAPPAMASALIVLAIGSVIAGYASLGGRFERFLEPSFTLTDGQLQGEIGAAGGSLEITLMIVSSLVAVAGIGVAALLFLKRRDLADRLAGQFAGVHRVLDNKYYVDEIYDAALVQPIHIVSEEGFWKTLDIKVIDRMVNGVGAAVRGASEILRRVQTGSVRAYAASLFFGVVLVLGYYLWR